MLEGGRDDGWAEFCRLWPIPRRRPSTLPCRGGAPLAARLTASVSLHNLTFAVELVDRAAVTSRGGPSDHLSKVVLCVYHLHALTGRGRRSMG